MAEVKPAPNAAKQVLFLSTFPSLEIVVHSGETVKREDENGRIVNVEARREVRRKFDKHECTVSADEADVLKTKPWYGTDFVTAEDLAKKLSAKDGVDREGHGFISQMWKRSVKSKDTNCQDAEGIFSARIIKKLVKCGLDIG